MDLLKKTIVITRPLHQTDKLKQLLQENGFQILLFPTLEIQPIIDNLALEKAFYELEKYHFAIFVSANAVISNLTVQLKKKPNILIIAIGPGTASSLQKSGIEHLIIPNQFTSQGILDLSELHNIYQKKMAIFCGDPAKPFLKEALEERGALVDQIICYRRSCPKLDGQATLKNWQNQSIAMIISTSSESLRNLCQIFDNIVPTWLLNTPLLVISKPMVAQARQYGFKELILAENATDEAIVAAVPYVKMFKNYQE